MIDPTPAHLARYDEVMDFRRSLNSETDRGCALMGAAFLDTELEQLLRAALVDNSSVSKEVLGQSRPVGTFSARIDLAYLVGLISSGVRRDLHLIRKIRNDFAHVHLPTCFASPTVEGRCRELTHHFLENQTTPRRRYEATIIGLLAIVHTAMLNRTRVEERGEVNFERARASFEATIEEMISTLNAKRVTPAGEG